MGERAPLVDHLPHRRLKGEESADEGQCSRNEQRADVSHYRSILTPTTASRYSSATRSIRSSTVAHASASTETLNPSSRASIAVWATQPSVAEPASRRRSISSSRRTSSSGVLSHAE